MFEKLFLYSRNVLMLVICTLVLACKQEADVDTINIDDVKIDTSDWTDYCIGYQSLKIPPGLKPSVHPSTNIDWQYPQIERNFQGSALDYIKGNERFGEAVFTTRVNGWDFVVAKEQRSRRVSDNSLVFFGAKKVENDVLLFKKDASVSLVGDGSAPKYRSFYEDLNAEAVTDDNKSSGFCYEGYVFSGYRPEHKYDFSAKFLGVFTNGKNGFNFDRHGYSLTISKSFDDRNDDERPLAPSPSLDMFPDIIKQEQKKLVGHDQSKGYMTHIWGTEDEADEHAVDAVLVQPDSDSHVSIIHLKTIDYIHPKSYSEGESEFFGFLANIKTD
ncbi:hypothetical protein [Thalassospira marina]|uniref:Tle cognate immunity protein 4 C-terminal domain-containing protein n=1 Tax=Thalassospira marina TaxID=2048283 RepID=A0A2N3KMR9_9PROT|nr:hypothetical protein [Thalassospira marina]PKR51857.1 hypothetical protein COO20_18640 [Thalassospira marina]